MLLSLVVTFLVSKYTITKIIPISDHGRFIEIDGLRGYLALMVAAHHFYIIFGWVLNDSWKAPELTFFNNLGVFAVSIFFMITGFLFIGKIDRARLKMEFDFLALMKSRVFRICPLYLFAVIITILLSFHTMLYQFTDIQNIIKDIFKWIVFLGDSVNGYQDSKRITAGVTWTLRYEWLFYISLLGIYFVSKIRYGMAFLGFAVAIFSLLQIDFLYFNSLYLIFFVIGGVSYFINKRYTGRFEREIFKSKIFSVILIISMLLVLFIPEQKYLLLFSILSFLFFIIIVMGGDCFGLLRLKTSRALGEISYSIYLMHGIVFFLIFKVIFPNIITNDFYKYSLLLPVGILCVVFFSTFTFLKIELPFIRMGKGRLRKNKQPKVETENSDSTKHDNQERV